MKVAVAEINDNASVSVAVPHYHRPKKIDANTIFIVFSLPHLNLHHSLLSYRSKLNHIAIFHIVIDLYQKVTEV